MKKIKIDYLDVKIICIFAPMKNDIKQLYDRVKTIKENATIIGVNESTITKFMAANDISRTDDNYIQRVNQLYEVIEELKSIGIKTTIKNIQEKLDWSKNTITKYKKYIPKDGKNNLPKFGIKSKQVIKNYSFNQSEILYKINRLHLNNRGYDADITYSKGLFYEQSSKYHVPQPLAKYDVEPLFDDVIKIEPLKELPIKLNSLSSLVVDLPFIIAPIPKHSNASSNLIFKRFSSFYPAKSLYEHYSFYIEQAFKALNNNGFCIIKSQSTTSGGQQHWVEDFVFLKCLKVGFTCVDKFHLISKQRLHSSKIINQISARKHTSVFFVMKKTTKKKFDMFQYL